MSSHRHRKSYHILKGCQNQIYGHKFDAIALEFVLIGTFQMHKLIKTIQFLRLFAEAFKQL